MHLRCSVHSAPSRHGHTGPRDLSAQSDESASTMSSSSASAISGLCYTTTRTTTMNVEPTYRWTRMLQSRVQFSSTAALRPTLFLADCIINIAEFEFSTGTGRPWLCKHSVLSRREGADHQGQAPDASRIMRITHHVTETTERCEQRSAIGGTILRESNPPRPNIQTLGI